MPAAPALVHQIFDQAFNQGNLAILDELVAADAAAHLSGWGVPANRLGLKQLIANLRSAFSDLHCIIEDEIGSQEKIAAHWRMRGTHTGAYFGTLPTGRAVEAQGVIFARTAKGWIIENWILIDQIGILQQIGAVPPSRGSF